MSSDLNFELDRVMDGTENMKKVGIYGKGTVIISNAAGPINSINDMTLRKSKEGKWYVRLPYRAYTTKDENGNDVHKKAYFAFIFPGENQKDKREAVMNGLIVKFKEALKITDGDSSTSMSSNSSSGSNYSRPSGNNQDPFNI